MIKHHLKHMAVAAAAVLVLLLVLGVDLSGALRWAALLACPVGMGAMILVMGRRHGLGLRSPGSDEHVRNEPDDRPTTANEEETLTSRS